ncbi:MAG TPA: hypothetical protein VFO58_19470 [Vicinamibacterales bacterium]|nr:hypothetical protein [Vicinamibacterales bacterium]
MWVKVLPLVLVSLGTEAPIGDGGQDTLRERVREVGDLNLVMMPAYEPVTVRDLARESDAIVVAKIETARVVLSPDEQTLFTDLQITVQRVIRRRNGPGMAAADSLVVRRNGGVTQLEGRNVVLEENDFPPLEISGEYLFFLRNSQGQPFFRISHGPQGVFRVTAGGVRQVSEVFGSWNRERGTSAPMSVLEDEIRAGLAPRVP